MNKKMKIWAALPLFLVLLFSCEQSGTKNKLRTQASPKSLLVPPVGSEQGTGDFSQEDFFVAFGLVQGQISASDAAKKVENKLVADTKLIFTERKVLSYDDEAGSFSVKIRGTKNGKSFNKEIAVTGFTHPYKNVFLNMLDYKSGSYLVFDKAIEENMDIDKFIQQANAAEGIGYTSFSCALDNGKRVLSGRHSDYELTASLKKNNNGTIKITAHLKLKYKKYDGNSEEVKTEIGSTKSLKESENYFTKDDVLKYVLSKTDDNFVKVDTSKFASSYYAMAKFSNATSIDFDMNQIQKYIDLYANAGAGKHLNILIEAGINNPNGSGIAANDFTGELTVDYCIATAEQLENQSGIKHSKKITRGGFQRIESAEDALRNHFTFAVILSPLNEDSKTKWKQRAFTNVRLFYVNDMDGVVNNPLSIDSSSNPYYLTVNGVSDIASILGSGNYGLSKDTNNKWIYIENIQLNKEAGNNELKISMLLCGGTAIEMSTTPFLGHNNP